MPSRRDKTASLSAAAIAAGFALVAVATPLTAASPPPQQRRQMFQEQDTGDEASAEESNGSAEQNEIAPFQYPPLDLPAGMFGDQRVASPRNLDTVLQDLARIGERRGAAAASLFARRRGLGWRAGSVLVRIDTGLPIRGRRLRDSSSRAIVDQVLADLSRRGARIRNVFGPHIEAWIPIAELDDIEQQPAVRAIRKPWRMRTSATSEGRGVIGTGAWDGVKFRGPTGGTRVGVIDLSFKGYEALRGRDLPPEDRVFMRSFRDDDDLEGADEHGAAVAEVIFDIEPGVTLYLAAIETIGDINQAIDYFVQNDVDMIAMSLGCVGCAPGDGTGAAVEIVERAPRAGIPLVTSAGNDADRHWLGGFVDTDNDGLHEFAPGDESNSFAGEGGDEVIITLNWDFANWFGSSQDFDLVLLDSSMKVVEQSRFRQAGLPGQDATEEIVITLPRSDTFDIVIQRIQTTGPQTLELFIDVPGLEYKVPEQSLSVPADGRQITAVGAVRWSTDRPEVFTARGPTKDGRMKPELSAPDGVSTESFGPLGFFGTSASAPHVVGAMALLRARLGGLSGDDALAILMPRLVDLPPLGVDNITGGGRLSLIPPS